MKYYCIGPFKSMKIYTKVRAVLFKKNLINQDHNVKKQRPSHIWIGKVSFVPGYNQNGPIVDPHAYLKDNKKYW